MSADTMMTVAEIAAQLRLTARCITSKAARGIIPAYKIDGVWRFDKIEFSIWKRSKRQEVPKWHQSTNAARSGGGESNTTATSIEKAYERAING